MGSTTPSQPSAAPLQPPKNNFDFGSGFKAGPSSGADPFAELNLDNSDSKPAFQAPAPKPNPAPSATPSTGFGAPSQPPAQSSNPADPFSSLNFGGGGGANAASNDPFSAFNQAPAASGTANADPFASFGLGNTNQ